LKKHLSYLLIVSSLFVAASNDTVFAANPNTAPYFEEDSRRVGYKTVNEAVKDFEAHCKCEVKLPTEIPDIGFTHEFGAFYGEQKNGMKNLLEIRFVSRKMRDNIFKIDIRSDKSDFEGQEHTLQDGTKGIYFENPIFDFFAFEKNNLQYLISIGKKVQNIETPKVLIDVANSIE